MMLWVEKESQRMREKLYRLKMWLQTLKICWMGLRRKINSQEVEQQKSENVSKNYCKGIRD